MKTTLPTLSEVVGITADMAYDGNFITNLIWDYNDFLKQPLKLEMFIPCKDGVPLEEPKDYAPCKITGWNTETNPNYEIELKEYQKAKNRVIFKGFEISSKEDCYWIGDGNLTICDWGNNIDYIYWNYKQISDLCNKVDLTDKEYKRLGL